MRYLFAGGGTGGHIYPALSIAQALQDVDPEAVFLFVGSQRGLEKRIIPKYGFELKYLDIQAFQRKISWDTVKTIYKAAFSVIAAGRIITEFRPDVVIGTGGYVSGPPVLAAQLRRIPSVLQEQNALPGVTTKALARRADSVLVGYNIARQRLASRGKGDNVIFTGNPIRPDITSITRDEGCRVMGLDPNKFTVLVFGASQGSKAINNTFLTVWPELCKLPNVQVVWQTGEGQFASLIDKLPPAYKDQNMQVRPYIHQMPAALAATDLVVSRAGAISLAEITARGIPSILVPLPTAAENHQEHNARALEEAGAAVVILERDLTPTKIASEIGRLIENDADREQMALASRRLGKPRAAHEIAHKIYEIATKRHRWHTSFAAE